MVTTTVLIGILGVLAYQIVVLQRVREKQLSHLVLTLRLGLIAAQLSGQAYEFRRLLRSQGLDAALALLPTDGAQGPTE